MDRNAENAARRVGATALATAAPAHRPTLVRARPPRVCVLAGCVCAGLCDVHLLPDVCVCAPGRAQTAATRARTCRGQRNRHTRSAPRPRRGHGTTAVAEWTAVMPQPYSYQDCHMFCAWCAPRVGTGPLFRTRLTTCCRSLAAHCYPDLHLPGFEVCLVRATPHHVPQKTATFGNKDRQHRPHGADH